MTAPIQLPIECCIFYDKGSLQVLSPRILRFLHSKYQADLFTESLFKEKLATCTDHAGILIATSTQTLIRTLERIEKEQLSVHKLHLMALDVSPQELSSWGLTPVKIHALSENKSGDVGQSLTAFKKALSKIIKIINKSLKEHIRSQKPTREQSILQFKQAVLKVLNQHYDQSQFRSQHLAKVLNISVSTLERKCQQSFGKLPNQLLMQHRLNAAKSLVENSKAEMSWIAKQCGFTSSSYFSVRFNEAFGCSPTQARAKRHQLAS